MKNIKSPILVIDPGMNTAEEECYEFIKERSALPTEYHLPKLKGTSSLEPTLNGKVSGIIILGSACSVLEKHDWQEYLTNYLKKQIDRGIPILGLCYGHQLLAHLLGADVGFMFEDHHKLSGFRYIKFKRNRLFNNKSIEGELVVTHREMVLEVPKDCEVMGSSADCYIDAFSHKEKPIWGLQSHPEAVPKFLENQSITIPSDLKRLDFGYQIIDYFLDYASNH